MSSVETNSWSKLLTDSRRTASGLGLAATTGGGSRSNPSLLVLGSRESGKSSLLQSLQPVLPQQQSLHETDGLALGYRFFEARDPSDASNAVVGRANVWILEGDDSHADLLSVGLQNTRATTAVADSAGGPGLRPLVAAMIVVDLSRPWTIVSSLHRWVGALDRAVRKGISDAVASAHAPQTRDAADTDRDGGADPELRQQQEVQLLAQLRAAHLASFRGLCTHWATVATQQAGPGHAQSPADDELAPTQLSPATTVLPDGALTTNLGLPVIVVATKCDAQDELRTSLGYTDETLDFVEETLRKQALALGAALVFTSAKEGHNINLLRQYVSHMLFPDQISFSSMPRLSAAAANEPADTPVTAASALFIPLGWDSMPKIETGATKATLENTPFADVVPVPGGYRDDDDAFGFAVAASPTTTADPAVVESGQTDAQFLASLRSELETLDAQQQDHHHQQQTPSSTLSIAAPTSAKPAPTPPATPEQLQPPLPSTLPNSLSSSPVVKIAAVSKGNDSTGSSPAAAASAVPTTPVTPKSSLVSSQPSSAAKSAPKPTPTASPATPKTKSGENHQVLANFFSSLVKKN